VPALHIGQAANDLVNWMQMHLPGLFQFFSQLVLAIEGPVAHVLSLAPLFWILFFIAAALAVRGITAAVVTALGVLLILDMGLWPLTMETVALVVTSVFFSLVVGILLGIATAEVAALSGIVRGILDFMQTMPAYVYLIPAVLFFGLGVVPSVLATWVFAVPPAVRLTELGLRQVPTELVEAGEAFGATRLQSLIKIKLPAALPSILAGVNQTIMLALSMVVIAGMIGGGGLGDNVLMGISTLNVGEGFTAGLAVVLLAIYLDRITGPLGRGDVWLTRKAIPWVRNAVKRGSLRASSLL
jgi:ABC-type proline/glycine betaine transport system permease subunit